MCGLAHVVAQEPYDLHELARLSRAYTDSRLPLTAAAAVRCGVDGDLLDVYTWNSSNYVSFACLSALSACWLSVQLPPGIRSVSHIRELRCCIRFRCLVDVSGWTYTLFCRATELGRRRSEKLFAQSATSIVALAHLPLQVSCTRFDFFLAQDPFYQ